MVVVLFMHIIISQISCLLVVVCSDISQFSYLFSEHVYKDFFGISFMYSSFIALILVGCTHSKRLVVHYLV